MQRMLRKRGVSVTFIVLSLITIAGIGLHLFRIGYPAQPVFDEAHFATYAADYAAGRVFEDIHPALGKELYAMVLRFYPAEVLKDATFGKLELLSNGNLALIRPELDYGNFPYTALRILASLFGVLLPLMLYLLMRSLKGGPVAATLAAFFVAFDSALLVDTRLIFLDGMMIVFGIAALACYFGIRGRRRPILAGLLWGAALSVKLTAIVFAGPIVIAFLLAFAPPRDEGPEGKSLLKFVGMGFAVLALVAFAGSLVFAPAARINAISQIEDVQGLPSLVWQNAHPIASYFIADYLELSSSIFSYTTGQLYTDNSSPWYLWPAGQIPMPLYVSKGKAIVLGGNLILWLASTLAIIFGLAALVRYIKDRFLGKDQRQAFFILLGGYLSVMMPFILFIHRNTYIYHYFPALIFAFGMLAWWVARALGVEEWRDITLKKGIVLGLVAAVVLIGFSVTLPLVYGL